MNLLLLGPDEIGPGDRARLRGRRARHVVEVLGLGVGDTVRVGIVRGGVGEATVEGADPEALVLRVVVPEVGVAPAPPVDLILALPRPKVLSRVLQIASSFGVGRIDLVNAWRVPRSYFQSPRLVPAALREALWLGCEQGAHTYLPDLDVHRLFVPFVEALAQRGPAGRRVVAHPHQAPPLERVLAAAGPGRVQVAIGPEGGWIPAELASLEAAGFARVAVSERVLRVEAAAAAILAQLELLARLDAARAKG